MRDGESKRESERGWGEREREGGRKNRERDYSQSIPL